jgi:poly-beta-1,6-N-acetyl-D-glucosamine synthase
VSVVIAAFNEEAAIQETLASILASDYPAPFDIIVVSDASTDATDALVNSFSSDRVKLLRQPVRSGQTAGMVRGAQEAAGEIVVMADASGRFRPDTLRHFVRHFVDPRVGGVSGYMAIRETGSAVSKGGHFYARYDRTLRSLESETGSSWVGCQGGAFAVRRALFPSHFSHDIAADNATCYELYAAGYLHRYDPQVVILERCAKDLGNEFRRKIRIIVLQLHGMNVYRRLLIPWKHPGFFFQNVSHKVCRWLVPFALLLLWGASAWSRTGWVHALFIAQCVFYGCALIGMAIGKQRRAPRFFSIPAYFTTVNLAGFLAWFFLLHDYTVWSPPARDTAADSR